MAARIETHDLIDVFSPAELAFVGGLPRIQIKKYIAGSGPALYWDFPVPYQGLGRPVTMEISVARLSSRARHAPRGILNVWGGAEKREPFQTKKNGAPFLFSLPKNTDLRPALSPDTSTKPDKTERIQFALLLEVRYTLRREPTAVLLQ